MAADELIASLCAGGRVDSHGGFTLDRAQAREKLRTFQVAEPHRYALHFVALAVLRKATAVAFEIDSDDLRARFDGEPLTEQDLEDLYSSSFAAAQTDADRARQQLAVGINAALALNPRHARVTSGPPGARVCLEVRHGVEDAITQSAEAAVGTAIQVTQRFRPGLLVRFVRHVFGDMPEATSLRERCAYASIPITIDGQQISGGLTLSGSEVRFGSELSDDAGRVCVAGLHPTSIALPEVRLVRHGVWISTLRPPHLPPGTLAVVRDDALQTDLSGQEVVHNEGRDRCMALVERTVEAATVAWLAEHTAQGLHAWVRTRLRPCWHHWERVRDPATLIGQVVTQLPWWADIFGRPLALAQLRAELERNAAVFYTTAEFAGRLESFADTVVAVPPRPSGDPSEDLLLLRALFGDRLRDRTRDLEHEVGRAGRRRLWLARPASPVLEPDRYSALAPVRIEAGGRTIEGQVGLRRQSAGPSTVRVIADGHLLREYAIELPLAIDAVLAGLTADLECEGPLHDGAFALALLALLDGTLWLLEEDMSGRPGHEIDPARRTLARRYLALRYDPQAPRRWLQAFGFRDRDANFQLALPQVGALPRICRGPAEPPLARLQEPWLADCERLPTGGGDSISLGALALALARGERVTWTAEDTPPMALSDRIVLRLEGEAKALALHVFGDTLHELPRAEVEQWIAEQRFLAQAVEEATLPYGSCGAEVRIAEGPLKAVLGVMFFRNGEPLRAQARVIVRGRQLDERAIWAPFTGVIAVVEDDRLQAAAGYRGIVADVVWAAAERSLLQALPRLVSEALQRTPSGLLGDVLAASFPSTAMRAAWEQLVAFEGTGTGEASYELLLGLSAQVPLARLDDAIRSALRQRWRVLDGRRVHAISNIAKIADEAGGRIDVAQGRLIAEVLREIRATCGQHRPAESLGLQVATADRGLFAEVALRRSDGPATSLAEIGDARRRGHKIVITRGETLPAKGRPGTILVSAAEEDLLVRLFGESAFERGPPVQLDISAPREPLPSRLRPPAAAPEPAPPPPPAPPISIQSVLSDMFAELDGTTGSQPPPVLDRLPAAPQPPPRRPPTPAPRTPEVRLLAAIVTELRALREGHERLLSNFNLDHLRLAMLGTRAEPVTIGVEAIVLNASHPLVQRAAASCSADPMWVDVLVSLVFTAFNVWRQEITDADEHGFHQLHLARVARRYGG